MSMFALERSGVPSVLQHGPPAVWEIGFWGGIRGFWWMNKTDMSNPAQYSAYLQAYVAQRRQISSDMPSRERAGMKKWVEMRLKGGVVGGGVKKAYPGQELQECGQLRQSLDALNCRGTVNHWLEALVERDPCRSRLSNSRGHGNKAESHY